MVEIEFVSQRSHSNPFVDVVLDVQFTDPTGKTKRVPAFWAGGQVWKVRFSSPIIGTHHYRSVCNIPSDKDLDGITGSVEIEPKGTGSTYTATVLHADPESRGRHEAMGFHGGWSSAFDQLVELMTSMDF